MPPVLIRYNRRWVEVYVRPPLHFVNPAERSRGARKKTTFFIGDLLREPRENVVRECCICLEEDKENPILICGHSRTCLDCLSQYGRCPWPGCGKDKVKSRRRWTYILRVWLLVALVVCVSKLLPDNPNGRGRGLVELAIFIALEITFIVLYPLLIAFPVIFHGLFNALHRFEEVVISGIHLIRARM